ncbi:hypothetical protein [Crocosphaera sp. XPORK-15E]|uniref:hypothetical protein n=1 Tax=Crocosphaera sp. XPORK-15E TaxID=3110247 RepID=UPI002B2150AC|nr:hypothetical protein [Crocosphaera sp. XPORK-15E]MEA5537262.1 hypothetical protein [Crocosphaera sp. XPORK-15E]
MCYVINSSSHSYLISQINRVLQEGKLTATEEKYFLDAMLCYQPITQEELMGITEIFSKLQSGKLQLIE